MLDHLRENWVGYTAIAVCLLPLLYLTRRWTYPILFYTGELIVYMAGIHGGIWSIVRLARWFKLNTTMYFMEKTDTGWDVPWRQFWNPAGYKPQWVFYLELVLLAALLYIMFRYRPIRVQHATPRGPALVKGMSPRGAGYDPREKLKEKGGR